MTSFARRPTFKGKHNRSKAKLLVVLYNSNVNHNMRYDLWSVDVLADATGLSVGHLKVMTWRLAKWRYIVQSKQHGTNYYSITGRGIRFVRLIPGDVADAIVPDLAKRAHEFRLLS